MIPLIFARACGVAGGLGLAFAAINEGGGTHAAYIMLGGLGLIICSLSKTR